MYNKTCLFVFLLLGLLVGAWSARFFHTDFEDSSKRTLSSSNTNEKRATETSTLAVELDYRGEPFYVLYPVSDEERVWYAFNWANGPLGESKTSRYSCNYDSDYFKTELLYGLYLGYPILYELGPRKYLDYFTDSAGWGMLVAKPLIYLYPESETEVTVRLDYKGRLTCTYPAPDPDGAWRVVARPDGTLTDRQGREYSYLFWEGASDGTPPDFSRSFVVRGSDTAAFLREKLSYMGLTPREYNEFIVYWLPRMQHNPWNLIAFQGKNYTDSAPLTVTPEPDSVLRVFMAYRPLDAPVSVPPQELTPFVRRGFTLVEWGGQGPEEIVQ